MTYCHRDLSENGITAIASGVFDPLSKLQTLYNSLAASPLSTCLKPAFSQVPNDKQNCSTAACFWTTVDPRLLVIPVRIEWHTLIIRFTGTVIAQVVRREPNPVDHAGNVRFSLATANSVRSSALGKRNGRPLTAPMKMAGGEPADRAAGAYLRSFNRSEGTRSRSKPTSATACRRV